MTQAAAAAFLMLVLLFGGPWVTVQSTGAPEPQPARTAQEQTDAPGADESSVLRVWNGTETVEMTMAAYLPGVVRGEMPATFEEEALKAQAVAERTYIYYHLQRGGKANHPDADVCMDHTCCNAWTGAEQAAQKWGEQAEAYEAKIQEAVRATDGQVMLYNGQLILAAFHSSSDGVTASCPGRLGAGSAVSGERGEPRERRERPELLQRPGVHRRGISEDHACGARAGGLFRRTGDVDHGSRAQRLRPRGDDHHRRHDCRGNGGTQALRPTLGELHGRGDGGDGQVPRHGLRPRRRHEQYGANTLASEGKTWQEILHWYYTDVTIETYRPE